MRSTLFLMLLLAVAGPLSAADEKPKEKAAENVLQGRVEASQSVDLYPRTGGVIREIHVDIGDRVKAGAVVAVLMAPELHAELQARDAKLAIAHHELDIARIAFRALEREGQAREDLDIDSGG